MISRQKSIDTVQVLFVRWKQRLEYIVNHHNGLIIFGRDVCRQCIAARLTAVVRTSLCESTWPVMEVFNAGENVQPATNAHEHVYEQGQL